MLLFLFNSMTEPCSLLAAKGVNTNGQREAPPSPSAGNPSDSGR